MRKQLLKIVINILCVYLMAEAFSVIEANSITAMVIFGLSLWLTNFLIRPILLIIALPINLLTLGIFTLIINTWMIMLVDTLMKGIYIPSFWISFILALFIWSLDKILVVKKEKC